MFKKFSQKNFNPKRDWFLIISFSFLFFIFIVLCNIYIFRLILSGDFVSFSGEEVTVATLRKDFIAEAVEIIKRKEINIESVLKGERDFADPSL